jgi:hypothetical protein
MISNKCTLMRNFSKWKGKKETVWSLLAISAQQPTCRDLVRMLAHGTSIPLSHTFPSSAYFANSIVHFHGLCSF